MDPLLEQLLAGFVDESQEIYERVTRNLMELEKSPAQGPGFDDLARGLHTLKGSAATLGLEELADFAHRMEDVILPLRGSAKPLPAAVADAVLKSLDIWMARLRAIAAKGELPDLGPSFALLEKVKPAGAAKKKNGAGKNGKGRAVPEKPAAEVAPPPEVALPPPPVASAPEPAPVPVADDAQADSWRVSTRQVIALLQEVERLREVRLRVEERRRELEKAVLQLDRLGIQAETAEARAVLLGVRRSLGADGEEAADIVSSMEEGLKTISTTPVRTVLDPLRRAVRDLCKATGKQAKLSVVGAEVSLDRRAIEQLRGPLIHLVRNAVDHGLEMPEVREARGKNPEGALTIRIEQQGNMLFIDVGDDGAGLDLEQIREAALRRALVAPEELASMSTQQLHQLIFRPGFSTRMEATEFSGRGVGLDVVRNQIQALQGHVEVQSVAGQGARFVLTLPADLGSSPVLVVRCGEHQLGVPMAAVESSRAARNDDLRVGRSRVQLDHREQLIPVQDLGALVGLRQQEVPAEGQPLLILLAQGRRLALSVDEVLGDRELVIRPLPADVRELPAYQGAATLARGELVLILRPDFLVNSERNAEAGLAGTRRALVVDDSLTARALHRTALETGGYLVHTASNGRQALEQLRHSAYDVMVCDIGMDEMDGYELTAAVRQRAETDSMPILLVSARDSDSDRQRGVATGADGFLTKKECVSGRLLAEVSAVIARRKGAA
ncbi:MAG: response regulator [Deltaproteobacteria bacterium]|nr:MAG: response regulator [Deltaproteobacteria bacterium]